MALKPELYQSLALKFLKRITDQRVAPSSFARSHWIPRPAELDALMRHNYVEGLGRVDQIWEWLSKKYGHVIIHPIHCFFRFDIRDTCKCFDEYLFNGIIHLYSLIINNDYNYVLYIYKYDYYQFIL